MHSARLCNAMLLASFVLALPGPALAQRPNSPGEKYALLVGVRQYDPNELRNLPYAEQDVIALAKVLQTDGYRPENIVVMTQSIGAENTRFLPEAKRILKELKLLLEARDPADTVLIALAGHGVQFKGEKESYFCPADAQLTDRSTLIPLSDLYQQLQRCPAQLKLLLVDACRNDPRSDNSRARSEVDLQSVTRPQDQEPPGGVVALFSCSPGERAFEHEDLKHGVFFYFVMEALKGAAARAGEREVTLPDLEYFVKRRVSDFVRAKYGQHQRPMLRGEVNGLPTLAVLDGASAAPSDTSHSTDFDRMAPQRRTNQNPIIAIDTSLGTIQAELFADKAPGTVKNFLSYVDDRFYDATIFHRVIKGFMIQGGGMEPGLKQKATKAPIPNESSNGLSNLRGTLSAARTRDPDSATSQFFINVADNTQLDRGRFSDGAGYCVFGKVIEGMDVVDRIRNVETHTVGNWSDVPRTDVIIRSIRRVDK